MWRMKTKPNPVSDESKAESIRGSLKQLVKPSLPELSEEEVKRRKGGARAGRLRI